MLGEHILLGGWFVNTLGQYLKYGGMKVACQLAIALCLCDIYVKTLFIPIQDYLETF